MPLVCRVTFLPTKKISKSLWTERVNNIRNPSSWCLIIHWKKELKWAFHSIKNIDKILWLARYRYGYVGTVLILLKSVTKFSLPPLEPEYNLLLIDLYYIGNWIKEVDFLRFLSKTKLTLKKKKGRKKKNIWKLIKTGETNPNIVI